jgi:hypothetical protein
VVTDSGERQPGEQVLRRRNAELAALNQMGQALSRLAEPAELLELIYTLVGQLLDNQNLYIALYDQAQQLISFPVYSIGGHRVSRPERRLGNGLTEYVIRSKTPVLATPFIRTNLRRELAVLHSTSITKSTTRWSVNSNVEQTHAMRQEGILASVLCRQSTLSPHHATGASEPRDGHAG